MDKFDFDIIVVGGGHAGVEAAHSSAKLGAKTLLITLNKKMIANMPCNPSIGGSAKGIVVREIDALGGLMGLLADQERLQIKMLNTGKGPGVQCLRAQEDKFAYPNLVQKTIESLPNLEIIEGMVISLLHNKNEVFGVELENGKKITSKAVILANGTYLDSKILIGHTKRDSGPDNQKAVHTLSDNLRKMGIELFRLKTGTPPRLDKDTIDFSKMKIESGMEGYLNFSYLNEDFVTLEGQLPCYLLYTNSATHNIIRSNLDKSAQYNGLIESVGPRYCPSIEAKIVNFKDKERHQLFLEPEYKDGKSIYLQGLSTSLDEKTQEEVVHSLLGLEKAKILKYGYAIEYDTIKSSQFDSSLRIKKYQGLYGAGQIIGTSGYEEAAGLGLIAGINAYLAINNKEPLILKRNEAYIGVMIDDLITKEIDEPYRLLSSRAEYRLLLRHDNADRRLTQIGKDIGLVDDIRYKKFIDKEKKLEKVINYLKSNYLGCSKKNLEYLKERNLDTIHNSILAYDFLKRIGVTYSDVANLLPELKEFSLTPLAISQLEILVKYEGYIKKQEETAKSYTKYENYRLPSDLDYLNIHGLALEARQKLDKIRPLTIGQASRINGVNPSDLSILILELKRRK